MTDPQGELLVYERVMERRPDSRLALVQATGIVAGLTVVSKVFGFLREASLAGGFGATAVTDAYLVAFTIPTVLFVAGAALGLAFIPVFAEMYEKEGPGPAYRTACTVLNVTVLLGCLVLAAGWFSTGLLVRVAAPGFEGEVFHLAVKMTRYMLPIIVFESLSGLLAGMLQTRGNFAVPAAVGILFNTVIIVSIVVLGPTFGIEAVALGTTIAVAAKALVQFLTLWRRGFRWEPQVAWRHPRLRRWGALAIPVMVSSAATHAALLVERMLASGLAEGSISALNYAHKLAALPHGVIGLAISVALYPTLSRLAAGQDRDGFRNALSDGLRVTFFILVPVVVVTVVLREPIVRLAFERGAFDRAAVEATSYALLFLALGILILSVGEVLARAFYSQQDTKTPMFVTLASTVIGIALMYLLVRPLGHGGLALAVSLGACFRGAAMFCLLSPKVGRPFTTSMLSALASVLVASIPMSLLVLLTGRGLAVMLPGGGGLVQILNLAGSTLAGMAVYVAVLLLLRLPEALLVIRLMARASRWALSLGAAGVGSRIEEEDRRGPAPFRGP